VYTEFFGLSEKPFSITPDPRYLYMSARHADALAHLIYGISESGGFIQLTGEVGTGKTTLIRSLLEQLPEKAEIALVLNPQLSTREFLQAICEELRAPPPRDDTIKALVDSLNEHLLAVHATGRRVVLIVDEAQTLSPELLEQVRLLTNLETAKQKLLQIILIGQPELREVLDRPEMRQLAQRVTGRYHLEPLSKEDTAEYVRHRLSVAGTRSEVFTKSGLRKLYKSARGIPRLINVVADRALLAGYTRERRTVDAALVARAASEVFGGRPSAAWWPWASVAAGLLFFVMATSNLWRTEPDPAAPAVEPQAAGPPAGVAAAPAPPPTPMRVAAEAGEEPATPALTLQQLVSDPEFVTDRDRALGELLTLWGASYDPSVGAPCDQAEVQGLRCLFLERSSLSELRRLNLPAVLLMVDEQGVEHDVVIASLGYDDAAVVANGTTYKLPLAELTYSWYGHQLLLWRPVVASPLAPGARSEDVRWLRTTLARIRGEEPPANPSPLFDAELEEQVRQYQSARLLTVDGIVGERTQVALVADLAMPGTPQLLARH
jgi:general secretion pathway protein A